MNNSVKVPVESSCTNVGYIWPNWTPLSCSRSNGCFDFGRKLFRPTRVPTKLFSLNFVSFSEFYKIAHFQNTVCVYQWSATTVEQKLYQTIFDLENKLTVVSCHQSVTDFYRTLLNIIILLIIFKILNNKHGKMYLKNS